MGRFRDSIFLLLKDLLPREFVPAGGIISRQTRARCSSTPSQAISFTGGLRLQIRDHLILADADRGGGINRLLQCWQHLSRNPGDQIARISLFYIFLLPSRATSMTYQALWDFVALKAQAECRERLQVYFATCERPFDWDSRGGNPDPVINQLRAQGLIERFQQVITEEIMVNQAYIGVPSTILAGRKP